MYRNSTLNVPKFVAYDVQKMVQNLDTKADCGRFLMRFFQTQTQAVIDKDLFDDGSSVGLGERNFTIYGLVEQSDIDLLFSSNIAYSISYHVYYEAYQQVKATGTFVVTYQSETTVVNTTNTTNTTSTTDESTDSSTATNITDQSDGTEDKITDKRPRITPQWLKDVRDIEVTIGSQVFVQEMGTPRSAYGDEMQVTCDFGKLTEVAECD